MNTGFYKDLDTNFELACEMASKNFSHNELIEMLQTGNIPQKQIAALLLEDINNTEDATILLNNLTGCDGKIREAVALKINQILEKSPDKYIFFNSPEIFANASIDINGNICRLVIDSVKYLKQNEDFCAKYTKKILFFIQEAFTELDNFIFRDKKYVINKQLFKLYWCLEAIKLFTDKIPAKNLITILERASEEKEYTIREKVAQILLLLDKNASPELIKKLQNDENYYVRNALKNY